MSPASEPSQGALGAGRHRHNWMLCFMACSCASATTLCTPSAAYAHPCCCSICRPSCAPAGAPCPSSLLNFADLRCSVCVVAQAKLDALDAGTRLCTGCESWNCCPLCPLLSLVWFYRSACRPSWTPWTPARGCARAGSRGTRLTTPRKGVRSSPARCSEAPEDLLLGEVLWRQSQWHSPAAQHTLRRAALKPSKVL